MGEKLHMCGLNDTLNRHLRESYGFISCLV